MWRRPRIGFAVFYRDRDTVSRKAVEYVYAPAAAHVQDVVRFMVVPLLTLTRIAMWQAPRIRRALKAAHDGGDVSRHSRTLRADR